jgi:acyl-CoA thioesterase FadM
MKMTIRMPGLHFIIQLCVVVTGSWSTAFPMATGRARHQQQLPPLSLVSQPSIVTTKSSADSQKQQQQYTSPPFRVYIEDTDAYGIMYNGNYLRAYERALQTTANTSVLVAKHPAEWSIIAVDQHRFKSSPSLGTIYEIVSELTSQNDHEEVWNMVMRDVEDKSIVYNSATLTIGTNIPAPCSVMSEGVTSFVDKFTPFRDEFDGDIIPIRNQLNFFERARSNSLGGPDALRKLQQEDGLIFVVSSIDQGSLVSSPSYGGIGQSVIVETAVVTKRQGMVMEFQHALLTLNENGGRDRIGQAKVTLVSLNATTRRPTKDLPDWLRHMINR